ncbi:MAG: hypothetical protein FJ202_06850 [Gemmatimonadetes bacterium]|nr:hypothetical protein [Gemmatimonadota bacterium]
MAVVYVAEDLRHSRQVAIKVLRSGFSEMVGEERFTREIATAARLQHPHILPIYDSGKAGSELYCVMPFVDGESLRHRLERDRRLSMTDATRLTLEVAEALSYAHSMGVVHRDIKPENILLYRNHAMVADFGIAKVKEAPGSERLTQDGAGLGTPAYMSPEQAFGEASVDGRSDLYSLACVFYEMVEGTPPFHGTNTLQLLAEKARGTLRPFSTAVPAPPVHVTQAVTRALARTPEERFAAVSEFADALLAAQLPAASAPPSRARSVTSGRSIAVLPFTNSGGSADDEFLADGLAEELMHKLGRLPNLRVVARASAFSFKNKHDDLRAVGNALGVKSLLTGSVRRAGARLRITADLTDVDSGFSVWSDRYDRQMADVFDVQDEIAGAIVHTLQDSVFTPIQTPVATVRAVPASPTSIAAYEEYLKGRFHWNMRVGPALSTALTHLEKAVELDPNFAPSHAAIAETCVTLAVYGVVSPEEAMPRAIAAADRALQLEPTHAGALAARGSARALYAHDHAGAEADYRAAISAESAYATAHQWYAIHLLGPQRRFAEARAQIARARELDPLSPVIAATGGMLRSYEGDHEQAIVEFQRLREQHPDFLLTEFFSGLALCALGRWVDATETLERMVPRLPHSAEIVSAFGWALAGRGDREGSLEQLAWLRERSRTHYVSPVLMAQILVALGELQQAHAELDRAVLQKDANLGMLAVRSVFDRIRDDARVRTIIAQVTGSRT